MMKQIKEFEEFEYNDQHITTDLGSAYYHPVEGIVTIQGHAYSEDRSQIEVILEPVDDPDFNVSASAGEGELTKNDLKYNATLLRVEDVESGEEL